MNERQLLKSVLYPGGEVVVKLGRIWVVSFVFFSLGVFFVEPCYGQEAIVEGADEAPVPVSAETIWQGDSGSRSGSLVLRDDFNGGPFLDWQVVRPRPDHVSFTRRSGCLTIMTQRGSIHGDEENDPVTRAILAKNLFLIRNPIDKQSAATITLHVKQFRPQTHYQQVGLLCYDDDDNYLKWSFEYSWSSPKTNLVLVRETDEQWKHDLTVDVAADGEIWIRVTKRGNEYECAYSKDGEHFEVAGRLPWGNGAPKYLGLLAKNGGNAEAGEIDVCIDSFEVRRDDTWEQGSANVEAERGPATMEDDEALFEQLDDALDAADADMSATATEDAVAEIVVAPLTRRRRQAEEQRNRLTEDSQWQPSHEQIDVIKVGSKLNNFCLDSTGHVLACCGDNTVRVYSQGGELVDTWSLDFAAQAIGLRKTDGAVFVGGEGRLARLSPNGDVQQQAEFPRPMTEAETEEAVRSQLTSQKKMYEDYLRGLKSQLAEIRADAGTADQTDATTDGPAVRENQRAEATTRNDAMSCVSGMTSGSEGLQLTFIEGTSTELQRDALNKYLEMISEQYPGPEELETQIRKQMKTSSKTATFTGIAVAESDLFVIASAPGYTYNAWRTDHDLQDAKLIVKGLRGCCGQMDCQTCEGDLWIPMNTQHKVCQYDRDGELINSFGKQGRETADAFGGCCEPKNMRFGGDGYLYCAESGPPVCVKRFTADGQFQDVVCLPLFDTGCVRVSVDMWEENVFLLSPNENAIYVFAPNHEG